MNKMILEVLHNCQVSRWQGHVRSSELSMVEGGRLSCCPGDFQHDVDT